MKNLSKLNAFEKELYMTEVQRCKLSRATDRISLAILEIQEKCLFIRYLRFIVLLS